MRSSSWWPLVMLAACSGGGGGGAPKKPTPEAPALDAGVTSAPSPSERECTELFAHAVEIQLAESRVTAPSQQPTADEIAKLEGELREEFLAECLASSREGHLCAMAAKTPAELAACQRTPSSSTSKSSVAPGGMTPAAPLSP